MAGRKEKKDGTKGSLLPKSIAGIKLPKDVRRKLSGLAKHPVVADLLAAGLVALAAKLKNEPDAKPAAAPADDKPAETPKPVAAAKPAVKRVRKPAAASAKPVAASAKSGAASAKPAAAPAKPIATTKAANGAKPVVKRKPAAAAKAPATAKPASATKPVVKRKPAAAAKPRAPKTSA